MRKSSLIALGAILASTLLVAYAFPAITATTTLTIQEPLSATALDPRGSFFGGTCSGTSTLTCTVSAKAGETGAIAADIHNAARVPITVTATLGSVPTDITVFDLQGWTLLTSDNQGVSDGVGWATMVSSGLEFHLGTAVDPSTGQVDPSRASEVWIRNPSFAGLPLTSITVLSYTVTIPPDQPASPGTQPFAPYWLIIVARGDGTLHTLQFYPNAPRGVTTTFNLLTESFWGIDEDAATRTFQQILDDPRMGVGGVIGKIVNEVLGPSDPDNGGVRIVMSDDSNIRGNFDVMGTISGVVINTSTFTFTSGDPFTSSTFVVAPGGTVRFSLLVMVSQSTDASSVTIQVTFSR